MQGQLILAVKSATPSPAAPGCQIRDELDIPTERHPEPSFLPAEVIDTAAGGPLPAINLIHRLHEEFVSGLIYGNFISASERHVGLARLLEKLLFTQNFAVGALGSLQQQEKIDLNAHYGDIIFAEKKSRFLIHFMLLIRKLNLKVRNRSFRVSSTP